jgi:hypothetical protein
MQRKMRGNGLVESLEYFEGATMFEFKNDATILERMGDLR